MAKKTAQKRNTESSPRAKADDARQQERHDRDTRMAFLAEYAVSGRAAEAARRTGVPARTGQRWVTAALDGSDPDGAGLLADHGAQLRARLADSVGRALTEVVEVAATRIMDESWAAKNGFKSDPAPQYMSSIVQVQREIREADRLAAEREGKLPIVGARIIFETQSTDDDEAPPEAP